MTDCCLSITGVGVCREKYLCRQLVHSETVYLFVVSTRTWSHDVGLGPTVLGLVQYCRVWSHSVGLGRTVSGVVLQCCAWSCSVWCGPTVLDPVTECDRVGSYFIMLGLVSQSRLRPTASGVIQQHWARYHCIGLCSTVSGVVHSVGI